MAIVNLRNIRVHKFVRFFLILEFARDGAVLKNVLNEGCFLIFGGQC